jgi:hypothetical protein
MALCEQVRAANGEPGPYIDWAKARLHRDIIDWADVIIVHHFPERWIGGQWEQIKHKRVIWRTCGQSSPDGSLERFMAQFPVEIVRYSPKERNLPDFAGESALIRFGKYPADYGPWVGDEAVIGNITQDMAKRGDHTGLSTWRDLTHGLPVCPAGPGSEDIGGLGTLPYAEMLTYLTRIRAYLYLGTWPASYTLGLMEAMLSGVPVVTVPWTPGIGHEVLRDLFEAPDLLPHRPTRDAVQSYLKTMLRDRDLAALHGEECRQAAIELFDVATVGPQWKAFLG